MSSSNSSLSARRIALAHRNQRLHETGLEQQIAGQRSAAALEHAQRTHRMADRRRQFAGELLRQRVERLGRRDGQHVDGLEGAWRRQRPTASR